MFGVTVLLSFLKSFLDLVDELVTKVAMYVRAPSIKKKIVHVREEAHLLLAGLRMHVDISKPNCVTQIPNIYL